MGEQSNFGLFGGKNYILENVLKNKPKTESMYVVYEDPRKRKKTVQTFEILRTAPSIRSSNNVTKRKKADSTEKLEDFRHEVLKFAIAGMKSEEKEKAKVALAVKLGAKQPKNKKMTYEEFKGMIKKKKEDTEKQSEMDRQLGLILKKKKKQYRRLKQKKIKHQ